MQPCIVDFLHGNLPCMRHIQLTMHLPCISMSILAMHGCMVKKTLCKLGNDGRFGAGNVGTWEHTVGVCKSVFFLLIHWSTPLILLWISWWISCPKFFWISRWISWNSMNSLINLYTDEKKIGSAADQLPKNFLGSAIHFDVLGSVGGSVKKTLL